MTGSGLRRAAWALVAALLLQLAVPAAAADRTIALVPAGDAALASMLLIASGASRPVLLVDPRDPAATTHFLAAAKQPAQCLLRPHSAAATRAVLEEAAGAPCELVPDLAALARRLWPAATRVVLVSAARYGWLLRAAAFAGAGRFALLPIDASAPLDEALFRDWAAERVYVLPGAESAVPAGLAPERVTALPDPSALTAELLRVLPAPPTSIAIANPKDREGYFSPSGLSLLAPLASAAHGAPLLLVTNPAPDSIETKAAAFIAAHDLAPTHILLVGDELALRSHRVPDPVLQAGGPAAIGGATEVRVELFSEIQHGRPQDYAVGRLVAEDLAQGSALLARQLHRAGAKAPRVEMLSNADQVFSLGETISRTTVNELRNAGVSVRARYGPQVTPAAIEQAFAKADLLIWEGHARDLTLEERGGISVDRTPPTVVLQGCYTLDRSDPFILFEHGTEAIVATSAAIYSASGSAFARAFFDRLTYGGADLGTAVRDARNYLFALTELKKLRGHRDWTKTYRAALAFALWGDPSAKPRLAAPAPKLAPAAWQVADGHLDLTVPKHRLELASVGRYTAQPVPRAMLGGLLLRDGSKPERSLKQLFFTALAAPPGVEAACPPASDWQVVSLYAPHTRTLSVLTRPPGEEYGEPPPAGRFAMPLVADAAACTVAPPTP